MEVCQFIFICLIIFLAAACPLGKRTGDDCHVSDPVAGYSFDLRPLSKQVGGKDYFSVNAGGYEYQLKASKNIFQTQSVPTVFSGVECVCFRLTHFS